MIKKLKWQFVFTNMLLIGTVLMIAFSGVFAFTYHAEKRNTERALEEVMLAYLKKEPPLAMDRPNIGNNLPLNASMIYLVLTDDKGNILKVYDTGTSMGEEVLSEALYRIVQAEDGGELISSLGLFYVKKSVPMGKMVAFTSSAGLQNTLKTTFWICVCVCLLSLLLFLWISIMLASLSIQPLEKAWRAQKQFVADVSHDLKTPLTVILANNNILLSGMNADSAERKWLESTEEEARRMRSLIDRMLELAGSEDMAGNLIFRETNISDVLESVLLQFEPVAFEKGVLIESDVISAVCASSNEESLIRLIHILLDNAIKYSPVGGTVYISLAASKQSVRLAVCNEGVIAKEDLPHLFERFYRADKARGVGGFGLGLSIAKNIAENLGGNILVESDEAIGTRFTVVLKK